MQSCVNSFFFYLIDALLGCIPNDFAFAADVKDKVLNFLFPCSSFDFFFVLKTCCCQFSILVFSYMIVLLRGASGINR